MAVFADATGAFVARLPSYKGSKKTPYGGGAKTTTPTPTQRMPISGCYLCEATDHFASDTRFHPLLPDGTHEKLSTQKNKRDHRPH